MLFGAIIERFPGAWQNFRKQNHQQNHSGYIFFFRGTPLLIQMFVIYFSLPGIVGFSWRSLFSVNDPEAVYKGAFIAALIAFFVERCSLLRGDCPRSDSVHRQRPE